LFFATFTSIQVNITEWRRRNGGNNCYVTTPTTPTHARPTHARPTHAPPLQKKREDKSEPR
ncbi:hypothetical protein KUCAC02_019979, partial [Chaenocephalus aceratus]